MPPPLVDLEEQKRELKEEKKENIVFPFFLALKLKI